MERKVGEAANNKQVDALQLSITSLSSHHSEKCHDDSK